MDNLNNLVSQFQNSFNFYILKNNYGFSDSAKEYLDKYLSIKNHPYLDDQAKYQQLSQLLNENMNVTLKTMNDIKHINKMWIPDYDELSKSDSYYIADIQQRSKVVCDSIQELFEKPQLRSKLSNIELYNLYGSYYQISSRVKNKTLTNEILLKIEENLRPISSKIWADALTNPENYKSGDSFKFIVHNVSKTHIDSIDVFRTSVARDGRISASLITDKEMGVYGSHKYGIIYPSDSKIVTVGYTDLYSYESKEEGNYYQNSNNSSLINPYSLENYSANLSYEKNGKKLNNESSNIYNEVLLDTNGLKPAGIYCITYGEKELSVDYNQAKKLADKYNLPLVDIDITLYRTKNNVGTYLTDEEPFNKNEEEKFAEQFLRNYYENKGMELSVYQDFMLSDLKMYKDVIIDLFLDQKKNNNVNPNELFKLFEQQKDKRKSKAENYNTYINEMSDLTEALNNFNSAIINCTNDEIKAEITKQANDIIARMQNLNKLLENTNSVGLSDDNLIYQSNKLSGKIMEGFSPFDYEKVEFNGNTITVVSGYKSKEELEQIKQNMLKQVELSNDPMEKRTEHAKRVINTKISAYQTNSTNIEVATYKQSNPELEQLKEKSSAFIDISNLDKDISNYDELITMKQQLEANIKMLEDNRKISNGASSVDFIEQSKKECLSKIEQYNQQVSTKEQELISLRQKQDDLLRQKSELDKKGFFGKLIQSSTIDKNTADLSTLKMQIDNLEHEIENSKYMIKSEQGHMNLVENNFLSNFALEGMSFEEYKNKLSTIIPDQYNLTDPFKQKELEEKLKEIENKLANMQISNQNRIELQQALNEKKAQVGINNNINNNVISEEYMEFQTEEHIGGMSR